MNKPKFRKERRKVPRAAVSLPVAYNISIPPFKDKLKIRARTKNISKKGISFITSNEPNSLVMALQIELPPKDKGRKTWRYGRKTYHKKLSHKIHRAWEREKINKEDWEALTNYRKLDYLQDPWAWD